MRHIIQQGKGSRRRARSVVLGHGWAHAIKYTKHTIQSRQEN